MLATEKITTPRGKRLSYLVEALSLSGYSGSPVMAFRLHIETHFGGGMGEPVQGNSTNVENPGRPSLLGIDWGHFRAGLEADRVAPVGGVDQAAG
jgi:hypothetical protein